VKTQIRRNGWYGAACGVDCEEGAIMLGRSDGTRGKLMKARYTAAAHVVASGYGYYKERITLTNPPFLRNLTLRIKGRCGICREPAAGISNPTPVSSCGITLAAGRSAQTRIWQLRLLRCAPALHALVPTQHRSESLHLPATLLRTLPRQKPNVMLHAGNDLQPARGLIDEFDQKMVGGVLWTTRQMRGRHFAHTPLTYLR
jgi:hypothetical protein